RAILALQERFAYFFLAASGSAIAFAIVRTEGLPVASWMIPIGVAVLCWGLSFWQGCELLRSKTSTLLRNWKSLEIRNGGEPITTTNPELAAPARERLASDAAQDKKKTRSSGRAQYVLFLLGAASYLAGHILRLLKF